jgi:hypothetical protein
VRRLLIFIPLAVLTWAVPASAHPAGVQPAVDYRTTVTGVLPATPGLSARFLHDGSRLEVRNDTGAEVEVLGYQGEPWWRVGPDGVWENALAPSRFADRPGAAAGAGADAAAPPRWERVSSGPVVRWQDHRAVWHGAPPDSAPGRDRRLRDWTVALRTASGERHIAGTLDRVAPPRTDVWLLFMLGGVAVVGLVGGREDRRARWTLAGALAVAGTAALAYVLLVAAHAAGPGAGAFAGQVGARGLTMLVALLTWAAAALVLRRRAAADVVAIVAGFLAALFVGLENAPVFAHAVAPIPVDGWWARLVVALVVSGGAGAAVAGGRWARRTMRTGATDAGGG